MQVTSGAVGNIFAELPPDTAWQLTYQTESPAPGLEVITFIWHAEKPLPPPRTQIAWSLPKVKAVFRWSPVSVFNRSVPPDWCSSRPSSLAESAPVMLFGSSSGENLLAFAVSEAVCPVVLSGGVHEEDCTLNCKAVLFQDPEAPLSDYVAKLYLDVRCCFYADTLRDISDWFAAMETYKPMAVPVFARRAFYSSWYTFHQNLLDSELEKECLCAREYGLHGIIVDDGWQTDDDQRGYAYCGDWEESKKRFPDMKAHIERIHAMDMKYLLWYSVPFVGFNSQSYSVFKGKYLKENGKSKAAILDPRFPEVRQYLTELYCRALREWDLDGFKLDFIDSFQLPDPDPAVAENYAGRDIKSLHTAVDVLLSEVVEKLTAIKKNLLFEFRQNYIGPAIRQYGNMFRAADCPGDLLSNRIRTVDLRLLAGQTAVHSDMLQWNPSEKVEDAALQILNTIFSVPQISVKLSTLPGKHRKMLRFWLDYCRKHSKLLLQSRLLPYHPEANYPAVEAQDASGRIIALYQGSYTVDVTSCSGTVVHLINATGGNKVILRSRVWPENIALYDCCGNAVKTELCLSGISEVIMPPGGLMVLHY